MATDSADETTMDLAAGFLRLALPLMSKHKVPVTPANYSVWYRHVSGGSEELSKAIEEHAASDRPFTSGFNGELYRLYVLGADEAAITSARDTLRQLIITVAGDVATADREVLRYEKSLAGYSARLRGQVDVDELRGLVGNLVSETDSVRATGTRLHEQLEVSRNEATSLREELDRARQEASTDALTGLPNRKALVEAMDQCVRHAGPRTGFCVVFADIDKFKALNDSYGHLLGDKVIRYVASAMRQCTKGKDMVARYGGEEFVILLPSTVCAGAIAMAERMRASIEAGRLVRSGTREHIGTVTVSFGVAQWRQGETVEQVLERADAALYRAKQGGRNRVVGEHDAPATG